MKIQWKQGLLKKLKIGFIVVLRITLAWRSLQTTSKRYQISGFEIIKTILLFCPYEPRLSNLQSNTHWVLASAKAPNFRASAHFPRNYYICEVQISRSQQIVFCNFTVINWINSFIRTG